MIDPLYDGEDEKYGDGRHLDPQWQKIREAKGAVINPETGLSWDGKSMGAKIRGQLGAARARLWDIREIGLFHDYNVGMKTARMAERVLEMLDYIPLFVKEMEKKQEKLESMLCRVADELQDPMAEHWCDRPAEDRKLLESLRDDIVAMLKEKP